MLSLSTHLIFSLHPTSKLAWFKASTILKYESWSLTYFPTRAIWISPVRLWMLSTIFIHSVKSGLLHSNPKSRQTTSSIFCSCSISGTSYKDGIVVLLITQSSETLQKSDIFLRISSGIFCSQRVTIISGWIPTPISSFTECCVGFDLNSSEPLM